MGMGYQSASHNTGLCPDLHSGSSASSHCHRCVLCSCISSTRLLCDQIQGTTCVANTRSSHSVPSSALGQPGSVKLKEAKDYPQSQERNFWESQHHKIHPCLVTNQKLIINAVSVFVLVVQHPQWPDDWLGLGHGFIGKLFHFLANGFSGLDNSFWHRWNLEIKEIKDSTIKDKSLKL